MEKQQVSALPIANTSNRMAERSTSDSLGDVSWIQKAALQVMCHSSTRPGTSYHVTQFTRPSPALVLQVTNAGARRPGYEARISVLRLMVTYRLHC